MTDIPPDHMLLQKIGHDRDQKAFEDLCARYSAPVFSMARRMGLNVEDAQDAVQDIFVKLWQNAHLWDAGKNASVKTWIYRIGHNAIIDNFRRNRKFLKLVSDTPVKDEITKTQDPDPENMKKDLVRKGLTDMPEKQRSILVLFYYQGLTAKEISQIHETTPKAIERHLARARENFRQNLEKMEGPK